MTTDRLQYVHLIAEAITEQFGDRCPDFASECWCCRVWKTYDRLVEINHAENSTPPKPSSEPTP